MSHRRISSHIAAGAVSAALSLLAGLVTTPVYLKAFGAEGLGVIGFVAALQTILVSLDAGIAISATRAVAQADDAAARGYASALMRRLTAVSWVAAGAAALLLVAAAPLLAGRWLNITSAPLPYVAQALMLAAPAIVLRWPIALSQAILAGTGHLVASSATASVATVLAAVGGIALAWRPDADLRWLFAWLGGVAAMQAVWLLALVRRSLDASRPAPAGALRAFISAGAMTGWIGVVGLLAVQADKIVLTRVLSVAAFGYYTIGSLFAAGLYALVAPVYAAALPRFSALAGAGDAAALRVLYRDLTLALAVVLFPVAGSLTFFGESIVLAWTGNAAAAHASAAVVGLLALAAALHGCMYMPYALTLAKGESRIAFRIALATLVACVPAIAVAGWRWGAPGAASAWLVIQLAYLVAGSLWTHRLLMPGLAADWLLRDVALPAAVALAATGVAAAATASWGDDIRRVLVAVLIVPACWLVLVAAIPRLRRVAHALLASSPNGDSHAQHPA